MEALRDRQLGNSRQEVQARMPNVAAAGGRPAENGATPGSESLYLLKSTSD